MARAVKGTSEAYLANQELERNFGAPSKDEVFLIRAEDFGDPDTYRALEDLVIELQLTERVAAVLSIFALPDPSGEAVSYLARSDVGALPEPERLDALTENVAITQYLMSEDRSAALLTVLPDHALPIEVTLANIDESLGFADPNLQVNSVSLAALQREISRALIADQLFIAPTSTVICVLIALMLFRSWRIAVVCAMPSVVGIGTTLGAMSLLGAPFDPFMAIVPTLLIVLGIADSVHVFHAILRHAETKPIRAAIRDGVYETMPAVILAGVTTMLAFLCLRIVGSPTVENVAVIGPIGLALTTLAVFLVLPPATLLFFRNRPIDGAKPMPFLGATNAALRLLNRPRAVSVLAFMLLAGLLYAHTQTIVGFRLMDHVPRGGEFRETLRDLQEALPGSDQSFVLLSATDDTPGLSDADRELLRRAGTALYGSGAGFIPTRDTDGIENALITRFQGQDGSAFALPLIGRLDVPWTATVARAEDARARLEAAGIEKFKLTGYSLMSSVEVPRVVEDLRFAFYVAVALVTVLAALLTRSVKVALLSLVPNLIPILGVEAWLALTARPLTITGAVAFTIAFGIAVDATIHMMNRIRVARRPGGPVDRAVIEDALRTTAAPIITTTIVLLAGFAVTMFSLMPSVSIFGQLTAAAMLLALIGDLYLFPSLLLWGHRGDKP